MGSLRLPSLDGREAAVAAAIAGGVFVIVGYGTGLGITTTTVPMATITKPAVPPMSGMAGSATPTETVPSLAVPPAGQVAPSSAPILTAPIPTVHPPEVNVPPASPSSPSPSTEPCATSSAATANGGLLSLDLIGVATPLLKILDGLPVLGSLLDGTNGATSPPMGSCPQAVSCCVVGGRVVRR